MSILIGQNKKELRAAGENDQLQELMNLLKDNGYIMHKVWENSGQKYIVEMIEGKVEVVPAHIQDKIWKKEQ